MYRYGTYFDATACCFSEFGLRRYSFETDLQVSKLGELFTAILELAGERLSLLMYDTMGPDIPPLGEPFSTSIARKGTLAGVAALMCLLVINEGGSSVLPICSPYLKISELGKPLTTGRFFT